MSGAATAEGLTLPGLARRVTKLEEREHALELRAREVDRLEGRVLTEEGTSDVLANQGWEFAEFIREQRAANAATLKAIGDLRKSAERASALPLAIVAFFCMKEGGASTEATIGSTLFVAVLAFFAPQLLVAYVRKTPLGKTELGKALLPQEEEPPPAPAPPRPPPAARERDTFTNER